MNNTASKIWRVAVCGLSTSGLNCLERLSLSHDIQVTAAYDADPGRLRMANGLAVPNASQSDCPIWYDTSDVLFLATEISTETVGAAIRTGRNVVLDRPWLLTSTELDILNNMVATAASVVTTASLRRWSIDFQAAMAAQRTGRIGPLHSLRLVSCEKRVPDEESPASVLREFGYHWLEQMIILADSTPARVFGKEMTDADSPNKSGFIAVIDFASGCTAQIEVNTTSRIGYRTGWLLEGKQGSYRSDRLYTDASDGEIVDEPTPITNICPEDPWVRELVAAWRGELTTLPTLADAAKVMRLIEAIEHSAQTGEVVSVERQRDSSRHANISGTTLP